MENAEPRTIQTCCRKHATLGSVKMMVVLFFTPKKPSEDIRSQPTFGPHSEKCHLFDLSGGPLPTRGPSGRAIIKDIETTLILCLNLRQMPNYGWAVVFSLPKCQKVSKFERLRLEGILEDHWVK